MKWGAFALSLLLSIAPASAQVGQSGQIAGGSGGGGGGGGSGTVTSISAGCGSSTGGGAITTSGTISSLETVNLQTGSNYAIQNGDCGKLVNLSNAGAQTPTIAQAGTAGNFSSGWYADVCNIGAGTQTLTPVTSTIGGNASEALTTGQCIRVVSDGTNYQVGGTGTGGLPSGVTSPGAGQLAMAVGTVTTNIKALNITETWNASGTTFDAPFFMNVTCTACALNSVLADIQLGGSSAFGVYKSSGGGAAYVAPATTANGGLDLAGGGTGYTISEAMGVVRIANGGTIGLSVASGGLVELNQISSDSTHTDATICEDTTTHGLYSGSGTGGICLGTSSARFKNVIGSVHAGLPEIMKLQPVKDHRKVGYGDPNKLLYELLAEDVDRVLPDLVGRDAEGKPQSLDYLGIIPVLVNAIKEQQAEIEELKRPH